MPRYKLILEYDGTAYSGWQKQPGFPSVQETVEDAVLKFCGGVPCEVVGAGRTDAGVHAVAQVAHVDIPKAFDPFRVMQGINFHLFNCPEGTTSTNRVAITHAQEVGEDFHARFSATKRHYVYRLLNRRARLGLEAGRAWHVVETLDLRAMREAALILVGHHDFTSFRDTECQAKSPVKTLEQLDITQHGEEIRVSVSARSFLHHQVRIMVGTLALVGKGRWTPSHMRAALEACDRTKAGPTAPPEGLYLLRVEY